MIRQLVISLLLASIVGAPSMAATTLKGTVLVSKSGVYSVKLENWKAASDPKLIPNTTGLKWGRFSPDGKLIAGILGSSVSVMFNDGSGKITAATDAKQDHAEAEIVEWVKKGKFTYEVAYPVGGGVKSVELSVDWAGKKITKGASRQIARNISGQNDSKTKTVGMLGAFDVVGMPDGKVRSIIREGYRGTLFTLATADAVAESNKGVSWPSANVAAPHSCFHSLSRDGSLALFMQNAVKAEWPAEAGDHLGFILTDYQEPSSTKKTYETNYVCYDSPSGVKVRNYHWTNDPKVIVGHGQANSTFYVIELETYPPPSASYKGKGKATWTGFPSIAAEAWGCDLWVGDLPAIGATSTTGSARARLDAAMSARRCPSGIEVSTTRDGSIGIFDVSGRQVRAIDNARAGTHRIGVTRPGTYLVRSSGDGGTTAAVTVF